MYEFTFCPSRQISLVPETTIRFNLPWEAPVKVEVFNDQGQLVTPLVNDPMNYLLKNFGGGKFKLNFHHRELNFVCTRNFKPEGEPKWEDLPGIDF